MTIMLRIGVWMLFLVIALGAFGAHGLRDRLDEYAKGVYEKAVFYHFIHGIAILLVSIFAGLHFLEERIALRISLCFFLGIILFSGSLYLLAVSGQKWLGAITPCGGILFLIAWFYMAIRISFKI